MPLRKMRKKTNGKQSVKKSNLTRDYMDVIKRAHVIVQPQKNWPNLRQPSLLEVVDSVTTYEVSATIQEWK